MRISFVLGAAVLGTMALGCRGDDSVHDSDAANAALHTEVADLATTAWQTAIPAPTTPPVVSWSVVQHRERVGSLLRVTLSDGEELTIDLRAVAVFDCRIDCLDDVHDRLLPLEAGDQLCLFATASAPLRPSKLWVNRPACAPGVPTPAR